MNLEHPGYPTFDLMPATDIAVRHAQARELAQTLRASAEELKSYYARLAETVAAKQTGRA